MNPQTLACEQDRFQIVDVRHVNEWQAGHIDGALHIPEDDLLDRLTDLDHDRPVVTVCRSGTRSARAADVLRQEGFEAQNLDGGMEAWARAGLPFQASDGGRGTVADPDPPPDDRPHDVQRLQSVLLETIFAVQEHFGDHDPSEDEIHAFLRDKLLGEGKTPDEADRLLAGTPPLSDRPPSG